MVSFQCDGCSDVVKKPKLDQHRLRCKASFTCIDCSKTFPTPADWKGHTSCISEAEKYQKSLYKPKNNHDRAGNANERRDNRSRNANNASWNKGFSRSKATGANDTPLGTPIRMSPFTTTDNEANPPTPNTIPKTVETTTPPKGQKRKADEISSSDPSASLIPSDGVKEEIKSSKKRKSNTKKDLDKAKTGADANTSNEVTSEDKADADKKKKGKKSKKETDKMNVDGSNTTADNGFTQKDKKAPREEEVASTLVQMEDKSNHENSDVRIEKSEKKTKRKSTKKEKSKEENGDENAEPDEALSVKKKEKKKQKIDEDNLETKNMYIEKEVSNIDESSEANTKQEKSNKTRKHTESKDKTSDKSEMVTKKKKKTKE